MVKNHVTRSMKPVTGLIFLVLLFFVIHQTILQAPVAQAQAAPVGRQLLGGWRLAEDFARGAIAIDFDTMRLWMVGSQGRPNAIVEYNLPAMGTGTDVNAWPRVDPVRVIPGWWPAEEGYANGLIFWRGKLWVAPRVFYDTTNGGGTPLTIYAEDGETMAFPLLTRQKFSGFVKRGPGLDPYLGSGGYESGQGTQSGPSLASLSGQRLIEYGWPAFPGANLEYWNERAPREPNYFLTGHVDDWVAWEPRLINGVLEGRWASDHIFAGGLVLPEGIVYWPWMGTGEMNYGWQSYPSFSAPGMGRTYTYRYDPSTYQLIDYTQQPGFGIWGVAGQELGPDGKIYLTHVNQWQGNSPYSVDAALKVYSSIGTPPPPPPPTPIKGDINLDHIVNSIDYSILNADWFTINSRSDLNSDGLVNAIDYSILNANWFRTW